MSEDKAGKEATTQDYWLVVRVLLTPPAAAAASQKWKIIYVQVLRKGFVIVQSTTL